MHILILPSFAETLKKWNIPRISFQILTVSSQLIIYVVQVKLRSLLQSFILFVLLHLILLKLVILLISNWGLFFFFLLSWVRKMQKHQMLLFHQWRELVSTKENIYKVPEKHLIICGQCQCQISWLSLWPEHCVI